MPSWRPTEWWWPPLLPHPPCPALPPLSNQVMSLSLTWDHETCYHFHFVVLMQCILCLGTPDDVFHNLGKEDHRQPSPGAPRNSHAGMTSLPPLSGTTLPPAPTTHLPTMGSQPFPKMAAPAPDFIEAHQGLCLPPAEPPSSSVDGPVSAPPSVCR